MELSKIEKKLVKTFRGKLKEGKLLKCPRCKHVWVYTGKKTKKTNNFRYTSCPKCLNGSVHIERHEVENK